MADQPVTKEKLINADKDVQVIEDFIKKPKDETVTTRFGDEIMTLKGLEEEVKKSGGYFKRYTTLAAANADIANIPVNSVVKVTSADDGGDYEKLSAGATSLTKSAHDPLMQANAFTKVEVSATERSAKMYTNYRVDVSNNNDDLHHFTDKNGDIVAAIKSDGTLDVLNLSINGVTLEHENDSEPLHVFTSKDGDIALSLNEDGRLLGAKPYDLGIDSLFAKATNDKELTKIGFYHDYVKASQQTAYNFATTAYTINDPTDSGIVTPETMVRMPSIQVINKNKLFVSWASYRTGNSSDQSHASMLGRFVTFNTKTKSVTVDPLTILMSGDRVSDPLAHRHAVFGTVLNKATGKPRHLCLYNTGSVNNSNGKLMIIHSDDDCKTWSTPRLIWGEESGNEWGLIPASLVRINSGIYRGRLVTACFRFSAVANTSSVAIVYSDDEGVTWHVGGKIQQGAFDTPEVTFGFLNEAMINLDNQGNLVLAIRNEGTDSLAQRVLLWARSYDGGNTLFIEDDPHLATAVSEGSLLQASEKLQDGIPKLLYSYPSDALTGAQAYNRRNMRVAISYDNGKTFPIYWPVRTALNDPTGYSHLVKTSDQDFILVEERNQSILLTFFNMAQVIKEGFVNV